MCRRRLKITIPRLLWMNHRTPLRQQGVTNEAAAVNLGRTLLACLQEVLDPSAHGKTRRSRQRRLSPTRR